MPNPRFACPNCQTMFEVSLVGDGQRGASQGQSQRRAPWQEPNRDGEMGWKVDCPTHGPSFAKLWPADERGPQSWTCSRRDKDTGEYCKYRVRG